MAKVNLKYPVNGSNPTTDIINPNKQEINPNNIDLPDIPEIMLKPNNPKVKVVKILYNLSGLFITSRVLSIYQKAKVKFHIKL